MKPRIFRFAILATITCIAASARDSAHPLVNFGESVFRSFRDKDFRAFYNRSVFSMEEEDFRTFLFGIRNDALREKLRAGNFDESWKIAFAKNWRKQWRHLSGQSPNKIRERGFNPILEKAAVDGIQWETTTLKSIEILLPVTMSQRRFEVKRDTFEPEGVDLRKLWIEKGIPYRVRLDPSTHGFAFMIGRKAEDSKSHFDHGINRNGAGVGDILIDFNDTTPKDLFYFCPDVKGTGGDINVVESDDPAKPNQRIDLLLRFVFGKPSRTYGILLREVMYTEKGPLFFEKPLWLGEPNPIEGIE